MRFWGYISISIISLFIGSVLLNHNNETTESSPEIQTYVEPDHTH